MNTDLFDSIVEIERTKKIPREYMFEKITQALITAYRRDNAGVTDNIVVDINEKKREFHLYIQKEVVEEVEDPSMQMTLSQARELRAGSGLGDMVLIEVPTTNFGRIAAQTAKQIIVQGMREAEHGMQFQKYSNKQHEILTALVSRLDPHTGSVVLEIGSNNDVTEVYLSSSEQSRNETLREGERIKVYVVDVKKSAKAPQILVSRSHPNLVEGLFRLEVPEVADGTVKIFSVAREAGSRSKIAVYSTNPDVDPQGACIGPLSARVNNVVKELRGEKIDVVLYCEDTVKFVAQALAPATVLEVNIGSDKKSCRVYVPDDQLSLAIGKEGQNARLTAKLTGCKIDIKPLSERDEAEAAFQQAQA
jgi:N utilization substance protein A